MSVEGLYKDKTSGHEGTIFSGKYETAIFCKNCSIEVKGNTTTSAKTKFSRKHNSK